mmetsp:Transcript_32900/g.82955  ORF Transcript_32900/g.82955 Transcript_32900/m.82955 type:complete len:259 (-) Transcript_32900:1521-2297(-)
MEQEKGFACCRLLYLQALAAALQIVHTNDDRCALVSHAEDRDRCVGQQSPQSKYTSTPPPPLIFRGNASSTTHIPSKYVFHPSCSILAAFSVTTSSILLWYVSILASTSGWYAATMRAARSPALVLLPMATVATGTPRGICRMDRTLSTPSRCLRGTGTPMTGRGVMAATMPGRCAAPPAPAMMHRRPRLAADLEYSNMRCGVRCALITVTSTPIPKDSSVSAAAAMVGRSESEPMMMPTLGGMVALASTSPPAMAMI